MLSKLINYFKTKNKSNLHTSSTQKVIHNTKKSDMYIINHQGTKGTYNIKLKELTCTCSDWKEVRFKFEVNNPKRLCKHLLMYLDIENLPEELKTFKSDLIFYKENKKGFNKFLYKEIDSTNLIDYINEVIYIPDTEFTVLYNNLLDWNNVYDKDGNTYGFLFDLDGRYFAWSKRLQRPLNYYKVEQYFLDSKFLDLSPSSLEKLRNSAKINHDNYFKEIEDEKQRLIKLDNERKLKKIKANKLDYDYAEPFQYIVDKYSGKSSEEEYKIRQNLKHYKVFKEFKTDISTKTFNKILLKLNILKKDNYYNNNNNFIIIDEGLKYGINREIDSMYLQRNIPDWYETTYLDYEKNGFVLNKKKNLVHMTKPLWNENKIDILIDLVKSELVKENFAKKESKNLIREY